jgi:hypothetical protein
LSQIATSRIYMAMRSSGSAQPADELKLVKGELTHEEIAPRSSDCPRHLARHGFRHGLGYRWRGLRFQ